MAITRLGVGGPSGAYGAFLPKAEAAAIAYDCHHAYNFSLPRPTAGVLRLLRPAAVVRVSAGNWSAVTVGCDDEE